MGGEFFSHFSPYTNESQAIRYPPHAVLAIAGYAWGEQLFPPYPPCCFSDRWICLGGTAFPPPPQKKLI